MHYEFMLPVGYARKFTSGSPLLTPLPLMKTNKIYSACVHVCVCAFLCRCAWVCTDSIHLCVLFSMVRQTFRL